MKYYSKTTGGFYDKAIHGEDIPDDAVELTSDEYRGLLDGQSGGQVIVPGSDGKPCLSSPPGEIVKPVWADGHWQEGETEEEKTARDDAETAGLAAAAITPGELTLILIEKGVLKATDFDDKTREKLTRLEKKRGRGNGRP